MTLSRNTPPHRSTRRANRRGATTVEFALCLPVVVLIFFAMVEFCRFFFAQYVTDQAAYEACRVAIVPGAKLPDVTARATTYLSNCGFSGATVVVTPRKADNSAQPAIDRNTRTVTVDVSFPFANVTWVTPTYFAGRSVTSGCTLNHEYSFMY